MTEHWMTESERLHEQARAQRRLAQTPPPERMWVQWDADTPEDWLPPTLVNKETYEMLHERDVPTWRGSNE